jgi:hypothetical protein
METKINVNAQIWGFHDGDYKKYRILKCEFFVERIASIIRVRKISELEK